jgi:hypothetical protein
VTAATTPAWRRWGPWVAGYAGLLALVVVGYRVAPRMTPDDAFIFYRYARNLGQGHGWVFNPNGVDINGATSPGWTALLAFVGLVAPIPASGAVLYALAVAGGALVMVASLHRAGETAAGVVGASIAVFCPLLVRMRGMESGMYLLTAALVLHWGLVRVRPAAAGVSAGLLTLARPEGAAMALIVAAIRWRRDRRLPWVMAISGALTLMPWIVYGFVALGTPLPGTLSAKVAQERSGYFGKSFSYLRHVNQMVTQPWSAALLVFGIAGLVIAFRRPAIRDWLVGLVGYAAAHVVLYGIVIRPPAYPWYYAAEYFTLAVGAGFSVTALCRWIAARVRWRPQVVARVGAVALVVAYLLACVPYIYDNDPYRGYRLAAAWLRPRTPVDATVAASEIGVLGWYGDRTIVDHLGLLDDRSAEEFARRDVVSWFLRDRPEYYVAHVPIWEIEAGSAATEEFAERYEPVYENRPMYWSQVRIYRRVDEPSDGVSPLLTPRIESAFAAAGVRLAAADRRVLGAVLADYVGSIGLQQRFDGERGVDFAGLLAASSVTGAGDLGRRLPDDGLVLPLAPRPDDGS